MARKLSKAKKKQYAEARRKRLALAAKTIENEGGAGNWPAKPLTPSEKLRQTQEHNRSLSQRLDEVVAENAALREQQNLNNANQNKLYNSRINGLQSEVARLRSLLANLTYGGAHVRNIESVGQGAA